MTPPDTPSDTALEAVAAAPARASAFLAALEASTGIPPVDEDEHRRLAGLPPARDPDWVWGGHLVHVGGTPVAYAGIRTPTVSPDDGCAARVDVAVDRSAPDAQRALSVTLRHVRAHAHRPGAKDAAAPARVEAWLRGATDEDLATATREGFVERGRLHVLGVDATTVLRTVPQVPAVHGGLRLRTFDPHDAADELAVVTLLARAYDVAPGHRAGTFPTLRGSDWFRAADLLLLEDADAGSDAARPLRALHWMKRRGDDVGEVYNLAVDPDAQGHGFGALLLDAGLHHLVAAGSREVLLWVAADNVRALALYRSRGFDDRWDDVSLAG